jgi:hypothetical protein
VLFRFRSWLGYLSTPEEASGIARNIAFRHV